MPPTPDFATMMMELDRAVNALSQASAAAVDPYRPLLGALLDTASNLWDFIADQTEQSDGLSGHSEAGTTNND